MNQPPKEFKRIPAEQLRSFGSACLQAAGMTDQHAAQLADLLTNSDLRGVRSHDLARSSATAAASVTKTPIPIPLYKSSPRPIPTSTLTAMAASATLRPCWPPKKP